MSAALLTTASLFSSAQRSPALPPADAAPPVAALAGYAQLGVCDGIDLDASGSSGSGGRALAYRWALLDVALPPPSSSANSSASNGATTTTADDDDERGTVADLARLLNESSSRYSAAGTLSRVVVAAAAEREGLDDDDDAAEAAAVAAAVGVSINASLLVPGARYTFGLVVTNFLGSRSANGATLLVSKVVSCGDGCVV